MPKIPTGHNIVTQMFDDVDATVVDTVSDSLHPQRLRDEEGAWQLAFNQNPDPGGGALGKIVVEGRLHASLPWVEVASNDFSSFGANVTSRVWTGLPILPHMRVAFRDDGGFSLAAGTTASVWIQE